MINFEFSGGRGYDLKAYYTNYVEVHNRLNHIFMILKDQSAYFSSWYDSARPKYIGLYSMEEFVKKLPFEIYVTIFGYKQVQLGDLNFNNYLCRTGLYVPMTAETPIKDMSVDSLIYRTYTSLLDPNLFIEEHKTLVRSLVDFDIGKFKMYATNRAQNIFNPVIIVDDPLSCFDDYILVRRKEPENEYLFHLQHGTVCYYLMTTESQLFKRAIKPVIDT